MRQNWRSSPRGVVVPGGRLDLPPPRIVARRAQSHAALPSNCLMLAVRAAKTAGVTATGCQLTAARLRLRPTSGMVKAGRTQLDSTATCLSWSRTPELVSKLRLDAMERGPKELLKQLVALILHGFSIAKAQSAHKIGPSVERSEEGILNSMSRRDERGAPERRCTWRLQ